MCCQNVVRASGGQRHPAGASITEEHWHGHTQKERVEKIIPDLSLSSGSLIFSKCLPLAKSKRKLPTMEPRK